MQLANENNTIDHTVIEFSIWSNCEGPGVIVAVKL